MQIGFNRLIIGFVDIALAARFAGVKRVNRFHVLGLTIPIGWRWAVQGLVLSQEVVRRAKSFDGSVRPARYRLSPSICGQR